MSIDECQAPRQGFPKPVPDIPTNVMQQFSMKGKVTVVTGAAEGIGGAVADAMAEAGGDVALWYNRYVRRSLYCVAAKECESNLRLGEKRSEELTCQYSRHTNSFKFNLT
jgi:hypothetical protein